MPTFVWQRTGRGNWAPSLFWGEVPHEMTRAHNAGQYVFHPVEADALAIIDRAPVASTLDYLAAHFPPPPPYTGKDEPNAD